MIKAIHKEPKVCSDLQCPIDAVRGLARRSRLIHKDLRGIAGHDPQRIRPTFETASNLGSCTIRSDGSPTNPPESHHNATTATQPAERTNRSPTGNKRPPRPTHTTLQRCPSGNNNPQTDRVTTIRLGPHIPQDPPSTLACPYGWSGSWHPPWHPDDPQKRQAGREHRTIRRVVEDVTSCVVGKTSSRGHPVVLVSYADVVPDAAR